MHRESVRREKAEGETLRNTIALLHTLFSILKSIVGPIKVLITLISNYKINKAYAQEKHQDNLITCFMDAMAKLGLINKSKTDGSSALNARLYPVRTLRLYNYVNGTLKVKMDGPATSDILTSDQKDSINKFNKDFNQSAPEIEKDGYTRLFIDSDALDRERECRAKLKEEFDSVFGTSDSVLLSEQADACEETDGTFNNIDKIEDCGKYVVYADSRLPRLPSQIDTALQKGYGRKR